MKKNIVIALGLIVLLFLSFLSFLFIKKITTPKKAHYHAAFVVFENGKKKDFSAFEYMYVKPCSINKKDDSTDQEIQTEKAHLHDNVGDLVHVERMAALWRDLFKNIHYEINYSDVVGYINGKKTDNFQNQPIHAYDTLAVFVGNNNILQLLLKVPTKDYIKKQEKKSKNCSD